MVRPTPCPARPGRRGPVSGLPQPPKHPGRLVPAPACPSPQPCTLSALLRILDMHAACGPTVTPLPFPRMTTSCPWMSWAANTKWTCPR